MDLSLVSINNKNEIFYKGGSCIIPPHFYKNPTIDEECDWRGVCGYTYLVVDMLTPLKRLLMHIDKKMKEMNITTDLQSSCICGILRVRIFGEITPTTRICIRKIIKKGKYYITVFSTIDIKEELFKKFILLQQLDLVQDIEKLIIDLLLLF